MPTPKAQEAVRFVEDWMGESHRRTITYSPWEVRDKLLDLWGLLNEAWDESLTASTPGVDN